MGIVVKVQGFDEGKAVFKQAASSFDGVVTEQLHTFGLEAIDKLKEWIYSGELNLTPKRRHDGNPVLVKTGTYLESFTSIAVKNELAIAPLGMNENMTNEELGEILEYGTDQIAARPHIRPLNLWTEKQLPVLAEKIVLGILGEKT